MAHKSMATPSHMTGNEAFTSPRLTYSSLDTYFLRCAILSAVEAASVGFLGTVLDVGCGHMPYRDIVLSRGNVAHYVGLDLESNEQYQNCPDLVWDGLTIPLPASSVDCAMATEVLEHCPEPDKVLDEVFRVLRPGGTFFFTVPFLWPLHDQPNDQYRYTPFALARHLEKAGFTDIRLQSMGGWDQSLAQMLGLYLRRRPMPGLLRAGLSLLALPLFYFMAARRQTPDTSERSNNLLEIFSNMPMPIGISGIAYKQESVQGEPEI